MRLIDLTGRKFGRLTVLSKHGHAGSAVTWDCLCDCGNQIVVRGNSLRRGQTQACGCLRKDLLTERNTTHNLCGTRLHTIWSNMRERCFNEKHPRYKDYGGRGITVCDEWVKDLKTFYDWAMANGYRDDLTIDRINNDEGYRPDNCRWATYHEQRLNQRKKVAK